MPTFSAGIIDDNSSHESYDTTMEGGSSTVGASSQGDANINTAPNTNNEMPQWVSQLMEHMRQQQQHEREIYQREMQQLRADMMFLRQQTPISMPIDSENAPIKEYSAAGAQETSTTTVAEPGRRPRPKLPTPDTFDGIDRAFYPTFRSKLRAKLIVDKEALGEPYDRMWYAFGCLTGKAASQVLPWMDRFAETNTTEEGLVNLLAQMDFVFLDRNLKEKATQQLGSFKQGNKPFAVFLTEYNRLLMEADGHHWEDSTKKSYMDNALSREMHVRLETVDKKERFEDYCQQLQLIADRMEQNNTRFSRGSGQQRSPRSYIANTYNNHVNTPASRSGGTNVPPSLPQAMDWEPTTTVSARNRPRRTAIRVSNEEMEKRKRERRCLRCGSSEHFIQHCPHDPPRNNTRLSRTHVHGPELEGDDKEELIKGENASETEKE